MRLPVTSESHVHRRFPWDFFGRNVRSMAMPFFFFQYVTIVLGIEASATPGDPLETLWMLLTVHSALGCLWLLLSLAGTWFSDNNLSLDLAWRNHRIHLRARKDRARLWTARVLLGIWGVGGLLALAFWPYFLLGALLAIGSCIGICSYILIFWKDIPALSCWAPKPMATFFGATALVLLAYVGSSAAFLKSVMLHLPGNERVVEAGSSVAFTGDSLVPFSWIFVGLAGLWWYFIAQPALGAEDTRNVSARLSPENPATIR